MLRSIRQLRRSTVSGTKKTQYDHAQPSLLSRLFSALLLLPLVSTREHSYTQTCENRTQRPALPKVRTRTGVSSRTLARVGKEARGKLNPGLPVPLETPVQHLFWTGVEMDAFSC